MPHNLEEGKKIICEMRDNFTSAVPEIQERELKNFPTSDAQMGFQVHSLGRSQKC